MIFILKALLKNWESFRDIVHTTSEQLLGYATCNQQDWFDENDDEIQALLAEEHRLHHAYQSDPSSAAKKSAFTSVRRCVQSKLCKMQDSWLSAKAEETQAYADRKDTKRFYQTLNAIYGPRSSGTSPLLSSDGAVLITYREEQGLGKVG